MSRKATLPARRWGKGSAMRRLWILREYLRWRRTWRRYGVDGNLMRAYLLTGEYRHGQSIIFSQATAGEVYARVQETQRPWSPDRPVHDLPPTRTEVGTPELHSQRDVLITHGRAFVLNQRLIDNLYRRPSLKGKKPNLKWWQSLAAEEIAQVYFEGGHLGAQCINYDASAGAGGGYKPDSMRITERQVESWHRYYTAMERLSPYSQRIVFAMCIEGEYASDLQGSLSINERVITGMLAEALSTLAVVLGVITRVQLEKELFGAAARPRHQREEAR